MFGTLCYYIGFFYIMRYIRELLFSAIIHKTMTLVPSDLQTKYGPNSYVLITGSSDGIGKGFAQFFAQMGFNLILWSRNQSKLEKVKQEIQEKNKEIDVKIIAKDFSASVEPDFFKSELDKLGEIDISVLVNNVGVAFVEKKYHSINVEKVVTMINVNTMPMAVLSKYFIERFEKRDSKYSSAIVNLSALSVAAWIPLFSVYGSTKLFNDYFTHALRNLYDENPKIEFLSVQPGAVVTPMYTSVNQKLIEKDSFPEKMKKKVGKYIECQPIDTARNSVIALQNRFARDNGYWAHSLKYTIFSILAVPGKYFRDFIGLKGALRSKL